MRKIRLSFAILVGFIAFASSALAQQAPINYFRTYDQKGLHVFETSKTEETPFDGIKVRLGGNFALQFQALSHSNDANPRPENATPTARNLNELKAIVPGFNLATANMNIDVQLADGIRLNLVTYLSSRHHSESWVKGGYIQFDKLKFLNSAVVDRAMEFLTIRAGHMEINYGDAHYRRSDNGNALHNPFIGNLILDAFDTQIGTEIVYQNPMGIIAMVAVGSGENKGLITKPTFDSLDNSSKMSPAFYGKLGYDKQLNEDLRVRLTGSAYYTASSERNYLYDGDRAGSRYYLIMENVAATTASPHLSGQFVPGFNDAVTAIMINPFVKWKGLEFFGTFETANGRARNEVDTRNTTQIAGELIYRLGKTEDIFVGAKYNQVQGEVKFAGALTEVTQDRIQIGAGWFITDNIVIKGEYVNQNYKGFPRTDLRSGGRFNGLMLEAVVGF